METFKNKYKLSPEERRQYAINAIKNNHRNKLISTETANRQLKEKGHPPIEESLRNAMGYVNNYTNSMDSILNKPVNQPNKPKTSMLKKLFAKRIKK